MSKKLDYNATWAEAVDMLRTHREAVVAISAFFIFLVSWSFALLSPEPETASVATFADAVALWQTYFRANWMYIVPMILVTSYGGVVIYVLLLNTSLSKVGDALPYALAILFPYFVASILTGWMTLLGVIAFIIPGLYLMARFAVLPAVFAGEARLGIIGSIKHSWAITEGVGWSIFILMLVVGFITWLISLVANLIVGVLTRLGGGPDGMPWIDTGVAALFGTFQSVILIAVAAAIYRQLKPQMAI